jgi:hypothetical protein
MPAPSPPFRRSRWPPSARCRCRSCTAALVLGRTGAAGKSAARDVAPCTHRRSGPIALMGCG